jgi:hypothetical protein
MMWHMVLRENLRPRIYVLRPTCMKTGSHVALLREFSRRSWLTPQSSKPVKQPNPTELKLKRAWEVAFA